MTLTPLGVGFLAIMLGVPTLYWIWENWPREGKRLWEHRLRLLHDDMRRRGLSVEEQLMEHRFRHAMAELQRRASAWTIEDPGNHGLWVQIISKEIADRMALIDKKTAKGFLDVVRGATTGSILTAEANDAILKMPPPYVWNFEPTVDDIAAVTTIRGR